MSLALRCLLASFEGPEAPEWIERRVREGLGGVCLFASNVPGLPLRTGRDDLVVAIDEEGGDVTRLEVATGSSYPGALALGVVDDVALTERVAASIGSEVAAAGVNLDFAPVADVNVNVENPVIGVRSFGSDPELVARHVAAFVRGLQGRGVAACAKHFPGHGATSEDSHLELPTVEGDPAPGLVPFRAAVAAGVRTIMTAHVRLAALDDAPATLSARVLGLLREELGFDGVVVADALEMKAISDTVGVEEGAVRALNAGADLMIVGRDLGDEAVGRIAAALDAGVSAARLREAAERVERLAAWTAPRVGQADREAGRTAARAALLAEGDVSVPPSPVVVELRPEDNVAAGPQTQSLAGLLPGARRGSVPAEADVVVVRDAHRHGWMQVDAPNAVVVEVGLPVWRPRAARGYVATHGAGRVNLEAAVEQLLAPVTT